jgi:hypothetical protein
MGLLACYEKRRDQIFSRYDPLQSHRFTLPHRTRRIQTEARQSPLDPLFAYQFQTKLLAPVVIRFECAVYCKVEKRDSRIRVKTYFGT